MRPLVLITRPAPDGQRLADLLQADPACEVDILVSPLQQIEFLPLPAPEPGTELIFTSRNGVRAWQAANGQGALQAWCVGDATASAAREAGLEARSAAGSVEDLLTLLRAQAPAAPLLHLRGERHRGDLTGRLQAAGLLAQGVTAYRQCALPFSPKAQTAMKQAPLIIAPLYSPQGARLFATGWKSDALLMIGAISPAIVPIVAPLAAHAVRIAAQPDGVSMLEVIAGLIDTSHQLEASEGGD
ncbi:uroporphyrinogen-III synthase [Pseudooceanicola algae]|uniref:Tetrapyrrole biosynthesis uroporphyrinogen III synthase domain-containing protein n=1 Tax=Pseudooceanicola algae TaxID=1537215 RepID=A0A418SG23_9RHOB|nr:uroporphyrinogen-III synthase [Pseudooceanicola algae]QPM91525.1 hypothetical protein PSAL_027780 [Pseudooceanicola algae]